MRPELVSLGSVIRQKPALWSATHVRPAGSTSDPVEMCRPRPTSVPPASAWAEATGARRAASVEREAREE